MSGIALPTARNWMKSPAVTFNPADELFAAIDRLLSARVATGMVLDDGRLVGIFTEKDSVRALSRLLYNDSGGGTVGDHMSTSFTTCDPDMDFFRVGELFLSCNFPSLPVVEGGRLAGVIERRELLASVNDFRRQLDHARGAEATRAAGKQADRPRGIGASQQAAANTTREQLVRLFSRRQN
jgi:CBS domain-containing protein